MGLNMVAETRPKKMLAKMMRIQWNGDSIPYKLEDLLNIDIGEELVKYRCLTGLSESEVAQKLGVSEDYIRLIEWGLVKGVSTNMRQRIVTLVLSR